MRVIVKSILAAVAVCSLGFGAATAEQVKLDVTPVRAMLKSNEKQSTWLRVSLEGFRLDTEKQRPPANLAIVLDKSGSMKGDKIAQAIRGAVDAISLLGPNDIVSVITYDSTVNVLVPATKLTDPETVIKAIRGITADGNTALFAGVSKGAAEVRKFLDKDRVNRVILLSDGLANVGPSSPGELGSLGSTLLKENISVSTLGLGLGYNEDLMVQIASKSGGNHQFVEQATELADVFQKEFQDVLSVVAQQVDVEIKIPEGIRPVRVLGNEADINGQRVITRLAQIYSRQVKFVVIEVEMQPTEEGTKSLLASVSTSYTNMKTQQKDVLSGSADVKFTSSSAEVEKSLNTKVLADVVALISSEQSKIATKYLDEGDLAKCRVALQENGAFLKDNALLCPTDLRLKELADANVWQQKQLDGVTSNKDSAANTYRKVQRALSYGVDQQQVLPPLKVDSGSGSPKTSSSKPDDK